MFIRTDLNETLSLSANCDTFFLEGSILQRAVESSRRLVGHSLHPRCRWRKKPSLLLFSSRKEPVLVLVLQIHSKSSFLDTFKTKSVLGTTTSLRSKGFHIEKSPTPPPRQRQKILTTPKTPNSLNATPLPPQKKCKSLSQLSIKSVSTSRNKIKVQY